MLVAERRFLGVSPSTGSRLMRLICVKSTMPDVPFQMCVRTTTVRCRAHLLWSPDTRRLSRNTARCTCTTCKTAAKTILHKHTYTTTDRWLLLQQLFAFAVTEFSAASETSYQSLTLQPVIYVVYYWYI